MSALLTRCAFAAAFGPALSWALSCYDSRPLTIWPRYLWDRNLTLRVVAERAWFVGRRRLFAPLPQFGNGERVGWQDGEKWGSWEREFRTWENF